MIKNIPIYEISIDLNNEETTVSFNSLVHDPAHEISFQTFANAKRFEFNDVEQVISGVAISADTPIYRYDQKTGEEYYVVFTKAAIKDIVFDYARRGNYNNLNIEHNGANVVNDVFMIHSYQVDNEKGLTAPERFKDVNDGSWIVSYKTENKDLYLRAKSGEWTGFSVEGDFILEHVGTSEDVLMSKIMEELSDLKALAFADSYTDYPEAATENAKIALRWAEKNGWGDCGTPVGKARANQLANKEAISRDTIARMAGFERHRQNSQKELGDGCGRLMWLAWGGDEGIEWASRKLKQINEQFAKKRISFDFDDTLTTAKGQDMARRYLSANDEIFIITARTQSNGGPVYSMAEKLGIKKENVYFTGGKHKWMLVKRLRIDKHIDNNEEELQLIRDNTTAEAWKI
jgi:hypothetical protein